MSRIVLVAGAGGVGKTTLAGAIAAAAARKGHQALALTVDPAHRLAQALGLTDLPNTPAPVPGWPGLEGAMLDPSSTWDALARRHSDPATGARLVGNRFFRAIAERFPAGQAYAAAEEMARLVDERRHDVIVVDTPPIGGAADFFEAPARIRTLLAGRALRVLGGPQMPGRRLAYAVTGRPALRVADRLLGGTLLQDVAEFLFDLRVVYGGVLSRAADVEALFARAHTVVATTADQAPLQRARDLLDDAPGADMTVLVNRVLPEAWRGLGDQTGDDYSRNLALWSMEAERQREVLADLRQAGATTGAIPWATPAPASPRALAGLISDPVLERVLS